MKNTDDRKLFGTPIGASAASGNIATIPQTQTTAGDGTASVALGFPPETFIARAAGGEPPRGQDMNGLLNLLSSAIQVLQAGYLGPFDAAFAQSIEGYPAGAIVAGSAPGAFWVSTADANVSTPGATGAAWQSLFNGYATQAWAEGLFATSAQLAAESSARASGDASLQAGIAAETSRAEAAEAAKGNLSGGNSWSGTQNFGGNVVVAAGNKVSVVAAGGAGSCYMWPEYYASGNLAGLNAVTHVLDSGGNSLAWVALSGSNGRLYTSAGVLAFISDMPKSVIINSSNPNATGVSGSLSFTAARAGFLKLDFSSSNSGAHKMSTVSVSGSGYTSMSGGYNAPEDMLVGSYVITFAAGATVTVNIAITYDGSSTTNYLNATGVIACNA